MAAILKKWHVMQRLVNWPRDYFFFLSFFSFFFFFSLVTMNTYHGSRETPRYK